MSVIVDKSFSKWGREYMIKRSAIPLYLLNWRPAFCQSRIYEAGTIQPCWDLASGHPILLQAVTEMIDKCM